MNIIEESRFYFRDSHVKTMNSLNLSKKKLSENALEMILYETYVYESARWFFVELAAMSNILN